MLNTPKRNGIAARALAYTVARLAAAAWIAVSLSGCASGSFSSSGSGTTGTTTTPNSNPASLPPLTPATANNTYVGTQASGSGVPENAVSLQLDQSTASYTYSSIAIPDAQTGPVANSNGGYSSFAYFDALGDETGATGLPGAQFYGLAAEEPSRFAFAAPGTASQQLAAMVPKQNSGCITPTAAAAFEYVTLFGSNFTAATDAAWGTFQLSPSFAFTSAKQYTEASAAATTGLIPFAAANCISSSSAPDLGHFIDIPASSSNANTEMRVFLGPTGLLTANLQAADSFGNPLPLPGVVAMVQPSSPIDPSAVVGSLTNPLVYRAFVYQPESSGVQYGLFGHDPLGAYLGDQGYDYFLTVTGTTGFFGNWQSTTSTGLPFTADQGIDFGPQDAKKPGLFPNAKFLYSGLTGYQGTCPAGTDYFAGAFYDHGISSNVGICSSPVVVMVAQHDGKYVLLITGIFVPASNSPTVMILVQE